MSCFEATGCEGATFKPAGTECNLGGMMYTAGQCTNDGRCIYACSGACVTTPGTYNTTQTAVSDSYCPSGTACYTCKSGYTPNAARTACSIDCSQQCTLTHRQCSGTNLQECKTTTACNTYQTIQACSGTCTTTPTPHCIPLCTATAGQFCAQSPSGSPIPKDGYCASGSCYACPTGTTYDSTTNSCKAACTDECTATTPVCSGTGYKTCGNFDSDSCREWSSVTACPSGQTCTAGACQTTCTPTCTSGDAPRCSQTGTPQVCTDTDTSSATCLKWVDQAACASGTTCTNGACTTACTPNCATNGEKRCTSDGTPQTCRDTDPGPSTCLRWSNEALCEGSTACLSGVCTSFSPETIGPSSAANGTTAQVALRITPTPVSAQYIRVTDHEEVFTDFARVAVSGKVGSTITAYFRVKMYGRTVLDNIRHDIQITCSTGDACYCKAECITSGTFTPVSGYCAAGTCGTCPSGKVFDSGVCVQCTATNTANCPTTGVCQQAVCTNGVCGVQNKPTTTLCGDKLYCSNGACVGCTTSTDCAPTETLSTEKTTNGCKDTITTIKTTTASVCKVGVCTPDKTDTITTIIDTVVTDTPNGTACGSGKSCFLGRCEDVACAAALAYNPDPESAVEEKVIKWEDVYSTCADSASACGMAFENKDGYLDQPCDEGSGLCKAEGACVPKCPTLINENLMIPGCSQSWPANAEPTDGACPGTSTCYACHEEYFYNGSACIPKSTRYDFDVSITSAVAQSPTIITPIVREGGTILDNANRKFLFTLTTDTGTVESLESFTLRIATPGDYPVSVTAFEQHNGMPFASVTKTLSFSCPLDNACCPRNSNAYLPDGSACTQDGEQGTCHQKTCVLGCTITGAEDCNNGKDDDCNGKTDCNDDACTASCGGMVCKPGEIICDRACTDTMTSSTDCGSCGNRCSSTEQCIAGSCTFVQGCDVICNVDGECGRGMICINPGSCTESYCAPANIVQLNTTQVGEIMASYARTFTINEEIRGDTLYVTIRNLAPVALHNFTLTLNIPKTIAGSASELGADRPFTVIQEDPVISFSIPRVSAKETIAIDLPAAVDPAFVHSISASGTHDPLGTPEILTEELTITSNIVKDGNRTKLLLGLQPHAELYGVRIPVQIPKCVSVSAKRLQLTGDYEVIQDDPLVVWTFDALTSKETIEIGIEGDITEDCKDQLTAFAVADASDRPVNPWIPLLLIPVIGIIIFTFSRFHGGEAQERLSKKEFVRLAMEQGHTPEQAEQSWKEYDKKW